jgi:hypothetical protein
MHTSIKRLHALTLMKQNKDKINTNTTTQHKTIARQDDYKARQDKTRQILQHKTIQHKTIAGQDD